MPKSLEIKTVFRAIDRMTAPIKRMESRVGRFARKASRSMRQVSSVAGKVSGAIGRGFKRGFQIAGAAVLGFAGVGAKIAKVGMEFEQSLVNAAVKFPGKIRPGTKAFAELEAKAREVGRTTEFMGKDGADALGFLAQAGFNADQAMGSLTGVVDLATVSGIDLAQASSMAADTLGAMGMKVDDSTQLAANFARMNDVLAVAQNSANNSAVELAEGLAKVGRIGPESGASIETLSAMLGTMADTGVKGADAGTALRNIFLRLKAPTGSAAAAVKKFAGDLYKGGKATDIVEVVERLRTQIGGLKKEEQMPILSKIFGARAVVPAMALMAKGGEGLDKFREKLEGAGGAAADTAAAMRNTTGGSLKSLQSSIESATLSLFNLQDGGLKKTIDKITEWVRANEGLIAQKVGDFVKGIADNFDKIVRVGKTLGVVIAAIWGISKAIQGVSAVLGVLNLIMAANPLTLWIIGITAAVALVAGLITYYWDDIAAAMKWLGGVFSDVWDWIVETVTGAIDSLIHSGPLSWLIAYYLLMWKVVKQVAAWIVDAWKWAVGKMEEFIGAIAESEWFKSFLGLVDSIKEAWGGVKTWFSELWDGIINTIKEFVGKAREWLAPVIDPIVSFFGGASEGAGSVFDSITGAKDRLINEAFGEPGGGGGRQMVSPGERVARSVEDKRSTKTTTNRLVIEDKSGGARAAEPWESDSISFAPTGSF